LISQEVIEKAIEKTKLLTTTKKDLKIIGRGPESDESTQY